jgi:2',3'-cyclic-nucleotide 2'-phosphodiesterase (5'-nucleotidase family)
MKLKIVIISILAFLSFNSFSQNIEYTYDAAGNRTARFVIPPAPAQAEAQDSSDTNSYNNEQEPEVYKDFLAEKELRIYPNPTRGKLTIEIVNYNLNEIGTLQVFDMAGRLIKSENNISERMQVDITSQPAGSYIMVIVIGKEKSERKIIKQ